MYVIAGKYKNQRLHAPKGMATRPTTNRLRESLFNICQGYIDNARFLDLFAGSGAIGFEALSRGAKEVTFVDNHRESIRVIRENIDTLQVKGLARALQGDVFSILPTLAREGIKFDIIFADPPYEEVREALLFSQKVIEAVDRYQILEKGGYLFIEESATAKLSLPSLQHLHLVSERKMGRAVLLQLQEGKSS